MQVEPRTLPIWLFPPEKSRIVNQIASIVYRSSRKAQRKDELLKYFFPELLAIIT